MLSKATLQQIASDESSTPQGDPVEVQFNPATLRLQIANTIEGGETAGRVVRQYIGSSSTTLTLDLSFDTADEGTRARPRDVRERTAAVEKYVVPAGKANNEEKQTVPRVRFHWGNLVFDGIIDGVTIDFDHFAEDGTPLRAKMSVSIKEQNSAYQFLKSGPGANQSGGARLAGGFGLGVSGSLGIGVSAGLSLGVSGGFSAGVSAGFSAGVNAELGIGMSGGFSAQASFALGGESAAEFSARVGVDPAAWRGLEGVSNPLSIEAGTEVGFSAHLSASTGVGGTTGQSAGSAASPEKAAGIDPAPGTRGQVESGFALSAAGGVSSAIEQTQITRTTAAADGARLAFSPPQPQPGAALVRKGLPAQARAPLAVSGFPTPAQQIEAPRAPAPPRADRRATSFGYGVPLRPTIAVEPAAEMPTAVKQVVRSHGGSCECGCKGRKR